MHLFESLFSLLRISIPSAKHRCQEKHPTSPDRGDVICHTIRSWCSAGVYLAPHLQCPVICGYTPACMHAYYYHHSSRNASYITRMLPTFYRSSEITKIPVYKRYGTTLAEPSPDSAAHSHPILAYHIPKHQREEQRRDQEYASIQYMEPQPELYVPLSKVIASPIGARR